MSMIPEYPSDPIAYLVRRKFGEAALTGSVSGVPEDEQETATRISEEVAAYRAQLEALEEEDLFARACQEREKEASELVDADEEGRFFNQPEAKADYEYWGRMPLLTLDEGVALSLDKDPRVVTWAKIDEYAEPSHFAVTCSPETVPN